MTGTPETVPGRASAAGFTLLELMVVCGVLAVLFGLGIGFLGKTDPLAVAAATLQSELRAAQFTARGEGLPTEVLVFPRGEDLSAATVRSRLLEPVVTFAFEAHEAVLDESLRGEYGGSSEERGRFGLARRNTADDARPLVRWAMTPELVDLQDGFAVRMDLFLERREACLLARLGRMCELRLDDGARPRARLLVTGGTTLASDVGKLESELALPLRQWCTLDFGCDGAECWLTLDGRELARAPAGTPKQEDADVFAVSPGDDAVPGIVDEVRLFAYALGPAQALPGQVSPDRAYRIRFDARGEPLGSTEVVWVGPGQETP